MNSGRIPPNITRFLSNPLITRVPLTLIFSFNEETENFRNLVDPKPQRSLKEPFKEPCVKRYYSGT